MAELENHGRRYSVHASGVIAKAIRRIHRRAEREGRGDEVIAAITQVLQRLRQAPMSLGEPLYRLSGLDLEVRTCVIRPILVDFAVHEARRMVFIKGVKLLTRLEI